MTVTDPETWSFSTEPGRSKEALEEDGITTDKADQFAFGLTQWAMMTLSYPTHQFSRRWWWWNFWWKWLWRWCLLGSFGNEAAYYHGRTGWNVLERNGALSCAPMKILKAFLQLAHRGGFQKWTSCGHLTPMTTGASGTAHVHSGSVYHDTFMYLLWWAIIIRRKGLF